MVISELYGVFLAAAVLAVVIFILALERFKMKTGSSHREKVKALPDEVAVIKPAAIIKGGSQGI
ncbi:MAG: hypothetical protein WAL90_12975 [Desulfobacterales bacterium]